MTTLMKAMTQIDLKTGITQIVSDLMNLYTHVENGYADPLAFKIQLKEFKSVIDDLENEIEFNVMMEASKWNGQVYQGYKIEISQSGRYSYSHIEEYTQLQTRLKEIEKMSQYAYKSSLIQDVHDVVVVDGDGVVIPAAHYTSSKSFVKLTKQKGA